MSKNFPAVEPHGALESIFENAWSLTGSVVFKPLVRLARNMIVLRHEGELTLINSVRLDAEGEAKLDALGKVSHVMRIGVHGRDDAYYVDRYCAEYWDVGGRGESRTLSEQSAMPIPSLRVFVFKDTVEPEVALLLEQDGGLLITCDSVQHWTPHDLMSPAAKLVSGIMGFRKPAQIGPPWRKRMTPPGGSLRADFERLAALPFTRLIGGHGGLLEHEAQERLKETIIREL